MIKCKNCRYKGCALCGTDHKIHAATCENYTPATHADRIRAMTDEELADFVWGVETAGRAYGPRGEVAWLKWLKQEVTNEQTD